MAPAIAITKSRTLGRGLEPVRKTQLTDGIVVLKVLLYELTSDVEFEVKPFTPVVRTPLIQQHVAVRVLTTSGGRRLEEREHLKQALSRRTVRESDAMA